MPAWINHMECVSSLGASWQETWQALLEARTVASPYAPLSALAAAGNHSAAVPEADNRLESFGDLPGGRALRLAIRCIAPLMAATDKKVLFFGGSTHGEADLIVAHARQRATGSSQQPVSAGTLIRGLEGEVIPTVLAQKFPQLEVAAWIYSSCVSSLHALILAINQLQVNPDATFLVAGVDALNDLEMAGFYRSGGLTRTCCRPYSQQQDGILATEGAAAILLTGNAQKNAVRIIGVGMGCDAGHPTSPDKNGRGLQRAIDLALRSAGLEATALGAVILHGTGTPANDQVEGNCIARLIGSAIPVTTIKGSLGHAMGAAGLFNVLTAAAALQSGFLPPTRNAAAGLPLPIDLVTREPRPIDVTKPIIVLASGFGGNNIAVIIKR